MNNFEIVFSICRIGLGSNNPAFRHQVERLKKALRRQGEEESAEKLGALLSIADKQTDLQPSHITRSRASYQGEVLHEGVRPPVDKESSTPLAEIVFPHQGELPLPIQDIDTLQAIESIASEWRRADELAALSLAPMRSCIFYGSPGTGKTATALALSHRLGLPAVVAQLDGIIGSFLGNTSRNISALFEFAGRYGCVLLLDEFDAIAKLRDDPQEIGEIKRVVNTLLQNLDKRAYNGFTVATTNHEFLLDPAVWRRFEHRIRMPMPALLTRRQIADLYLRAAGEEEISGTQRDALISLVAWATEGLTGNDIKALIHNMRRVSVLRPEERKLDTVRRFALSQNATAAPNMKVLLEAEEKSIATALRHDAMLKQEHIAWLFGKTQSTIARWLKAEPGNDRHAE